VVGPRQYCALEEIEGGPWIVKKTAKEVAEWLWFIKQIELTPWEAWIVRVTWTCDWASSIHPSSCTPTDAQSERKP